MVFDDSVRTDSSVARHGEATSEFLNRAAGAYWARIRVLIEEWFGRLCPESQADVAARLHSSDDRTFRAAFWELYCHETLLRLGYEVECHPESGAGARRADYLARRAGTELLVEATVAADPDEQVARERREAQVYDALNRLNSPNHFLFVEVNIAGPGSPSVARLRPRLERWLEALDPDELGELMASDDGYLISEKAPAFVWEDEGWSIRFKPIPKRPDRRGQDGLRPVGMQGPGQAYLLDDRGKIRRAVKDKASAYGHPDCPYIVAVAAASFTTDDIDVTDALFGSEQFTFIPDTDGGEPTVVPLRAGDGVFSGARGPQRTRVSGVLVAKHLEPWSILQCVPTLWHHPAADSPVVIESSPWQHAAVDPESGVLEFTEPTIDLPSFFGLADQWPGPEEPFED